MRKGTHAANSSDDTRPSHGTPNPESPPAPPGSIVVAHDGSSGADHALRMAFELAEALSCSMIVIRTWSIDKPPGGLMHEGYVASFHEVSDRVRANVTSDALALQQAHPSVAAEYRGVLGQPAEVLISTARHARMLIVGSRGHGGFASLLLGSVSEQCVRHATCPVLVVHPSAES